MSLFEILQRFKGHFLNELRFSFKGLSVAKNCLRPESAPFKNLLASV